MRRRPKLIALVAALSLALPSTALAQSAGDDQYEDPFANQEQPQGGGGNSGGGNGGGGNSGAGAGGGGADQGNSAQASASQAPSGGDGSQGQTAQAGDALPRTGMPVFLLLAYGWALLVGGSALRLLGRAGR